MDVLLMVNAVLASILSFFIPGLGQALAGDVKKGIIFFIGAIILAIVSWMIFNTLIVHLIGLVYSVYAGYDAYIMAQWFYFFKMAPRSLPWKQNLKSAASWLKKQ